MESNKALEIAEICGIHAGDGYLRNDGKRRELDISGNIEEKEYYDKHIIPLFNKFFNIQSKGRYFPYRNTYGFVIRDIKIIEFMNKLGFPYGAKSLKVKVPSFILEDDLAISLNTTSPNSTLLPLFFFIYWLTAALSMCNSSAILFCFKPRSFIYIAICRLMAGMM